MTITLETYLLVSLAFAVFAAVVAVGSSLVLGASFERLKISFEVIQKQTGFFSDSLFRMENRVEKLEKNEEHAEEEQSSEHVFITADDSSDGKADQSHASLWAGAEAEGVRFH